MSANEAPDPQGDEGEAPVTHGAPVCMGIVNLTPDSFSGDGVLNKSIDSLVARVAAICAEGAGIVDVGAMSTRPGHVEITPEEELSRLTPCLPAVIRAAGHIEVSVDTFRAGVADVAVSRGARIINSVWGALLPDGTVNFELLAVVRDADARLVLMHNGGTSQPRVGGLGGYYEASSMPPREESIVHFVADNLRRQIHIAVDAGLDPSRLIIDPGIGFGVTPEQSLQLLGGLDAFVRIGIPLLISASRKSVVGYATGAELTDHRQRDAGTHALTALAVAAGARIIRAHDVAGNVSAMAMAQAVASGHFADRT